MTGMSDFPTNAPSGSALLTDAEKARFGTWLEFEAQQCAAMADLMVKQGMPDQLVKKERLEAMAAAIMAKKIRSYERMEVG